MARLATLSAAPSARALKVGDTGKVIGAPRVAGSAAIIYCDVAAAVDSVRRACRRHSVEANLDALRPRVVFEADACTRTGNASCSIRARSGMRRVGVRTLW